MANGRSLLDFFVVVHGIRRQDNRAGGAGHPDHQLPGGVTTHLDGVNAGSQSMDSGHQAQPRIVPQSLQVVDVGGFGG